MALTERPAARRRDLSVLGPLPCPPALPDPTILLGALPVAVLLLDADDRFRFANPAAEQLLGMSAGQLAQRRLSELIPPGNRLALLVRQVRAGGDTIADHEITLDSSRLACHAVSAQVSPLPEEPGAVLLVLQDTAAARALDRQLAYRGAARSVGGVAAMLAHEVKNPLSGIRGAAQLLETSVAASDRELAVLIREEADRIRALVDRMAMFNERPPPRDAVNIHDVMGHVRRLAQNGCAAGVRIRELYDPSLPPVRGSRDLLVQAALNLVKNAAEALAGRADGEIVLATGYQHGRRLALPGSPCRRELGLFAAVRDNGPGISDDIRAHLFEPFVTTKAAGSGLGLALVAKVIGDHGGLVELDSRPGHTEFRLHLPAAEEDAG